jgi:polyribonucleotide nucleotidyltransferase
VLQVVEILQTRRPSASKKNAHLAPDRPSIRPLFLEGYLNEVRSSSTVLSVRPWKSIRTSCIDWRFGYPVHRWHPFLAPIGAARIGYANGSTS